ncbi:tRNA pseudouridine(13) synthase TruD, partial [Candidatus Woesearchaeota archaeon]
MYKLKQIPDDFIVEEINEDLELKDSGNYSTYKLTKKEYNTI